MCILGKENGMRICNGILQTIMERMGKGSGKILVYGYSTQDIIHDL